MKHLNLLYLTLLTLFLIPMTVNAVSISEIDSIGVMQSETINVSSSSYEYVSQVCSAGDTFAGSVEVIATIPENRTATINVMIMDSDNFNHFRSASAYQPVIQENGVNSYSWSISVETDDTWYVVFLNPHTSHTVIIQVTIGATNFLPLILVTGSAVVVLAVAGLVYMKRKVIKQKIDEKNAKREQAAADGEPPFYLKGSRAVEVWVIFAYCGLCIIYGVFMFLNQDNVGIGIAGLGLLTLQSTLSSPRGEYSLYGLITTVLGTVVWWSLVMGIAKLAFHFLVLDIILAILSSYATLFLILRHWVGARNLAIKPPI